MIMTIAGVLYLVLSSTTNRTGFENLAWALGLAYIPGEFFRNWQINREKKKQESELGNN